LLLPLKADGSAARRGDDGEGGGGGGGIGGARMEWLEQSWAMWERLERSWERWERLEQSCAWRWWVGGGKVLGHHDAQDDDDGGDGSTREDLGVERFHSPSPMVIESDLISLVAYSNAVRAWPDVQSRARECARRR
jgi:hypothetical protein